MRSDLKEGFILREWKFKIPLVTNFIYIGIQWMVEQECQWENEIFLWEWAMEKWESLLGQTLGRWRSYEQEDYSYTCWKSMQNHNPLVTGLPVYPMAYHVYPYTWSTPTIAFSEMHWPFCCSSNMPSLFWAQGLCTCCSLCQVSLELKPFSWRSFSSLLRYHFSEQFSLTPLSKITPTPTPLRH